MTRATTNGAVLRDAWRLSVGTLTAVPVAAPATVDRRRAGLAMGLAPLAALPLGAIVAAVVALGHWWGLPALVTAFLAIGAMILGNRAFHLDGLSDFVDGLSASFDPQRSLAVMKTGTSGPAGVAATVVVVGVQVATVAALTGGSAWWRLAILAGVVVAASRMVLVLCVTRGVPPAREDGLARTFTQTVAPAVSVLVVVVTTAALTLVSAWAGLDWWRGLVAGLAMVIVTVVVLIKARRRLGGVTGDVFGACVEFGLATALVVLS